MKLKLIAVSTMIVVMVSIFIFSCSVNNEGDIVPQSQKGIKQKETPLPEAKQITSSNALTYSLQFRIHMVVVL